MENKFLSCLRSSHRRCSVRKGVLRNFAKFTGKHLCQSLFFNKTPFFTSLFFYRTPLGGCFCCFPRVFIFQRNVPQNTGDMHPKMMVNFQQDKRIAELKLLIPAYNLIGPEEHILHRFTWLTSHFLSSIVISKKFGRNKCLNFFSKACFSKIEI